MKKKLIKLFKNPEIFFRDYLLKKNPIINSEQKYKECEEYYVHVVEEKVCYIENSIGVNTHLDVDIVYTWVNDKDPNWIEKRKKYSARNVACDGSANDARFENHNELYYSILSVRKYLPWVRNIYVITDNQKPEWFVEGDGLYIVDHTDIIDPQYLPTFNSHVIEAHLHKIKGLAEHFIYFNDDVMVAKPLQKEHFFRKNGLTSIFASQKSLKEMQSKGVETATLQASENSNKILMRQYRTNINTPLVHTYVPLTKTAFKECWENNYKYIQSFLVNKYRSKNDLNMATFLVPWSIYLNGRGIVTSEICYYFNIRSNNALNQYKKLILRKDNGKGAHSFCVNDFKSDKSNLKNFSKELEDFLKNYYF